jgi:hypothetical protein
LRTFILVCTIVAFVIIAVYATQSVLSLSRFKVKVERASEPFKERWNTARGVLLSVAGVLVGGAAVLFVLLPSSKQPAASNIQRQHGYTASVIPLKATIRFSNPRGTFQNPLPVRCQLGIQVAGRIPASYAFAVGNAIVGQKADVLFVPESAASRIATDIWTVPMVFGMDGNGGRKFTVYLMILPKEQLLYLVAEAQSVRSYVSGKYAEQSWWSAPGLPPRPAIVLDRETVQRSSDTGCPKQ